MRCVKRINGGVITVEQGHWDMYLYAAKGLALFLHDTPDPCEFIKQVSIHHRYYNLLTSGEGVRHQKSTFIDDQDLRPLPSRSRFPIFAYLISKFLRTFNPEAYASKGMNSHTANITGCYAYC